MKQASLQKEIILPDKKVADVILYVPDGENFAVLVAQRRTDTNLMVLSLNDLSTATYRLAGEYDTCWVKDDVLYTASFMEVDGGLVLEGRDYVPYYGAGQEKRLIGANWIYRLEDGQDPEQYTVLAQVDLNSIQMIAVAVLGGETEVNWRDDTLNVTSTEDEDVSLRFSIQGLQFLKD